MTVIFSNDLLTKNLIIKLFDLCCVRVPFEPCFQITHFINYVLKSNAIARQLEDNNWIVQGNMLNRLNVHTLDIWVAIHKLSESLIKLVENHNNE